MVLVLMCMCIQSFEALNYKYLKTTNKASWWTEQMKDQRLHIKAWIIQMESKADIFSGRDG